MDLWTELPTFISSPLKNKPYEQEQLITIARIVGCIAISVISGLSSLAGLGGGGPNIVVLILCFNFMPKQATIVVFACILGSSFGNMVNQMRKAYNGQPMIRYDYAFVSLPLMFLGSLVGVLLNQILPSFFIVAVIIGVATNSLPKIYQRFQDGHRRQTQELLLQEQNERQSDLIKETIINPFDDPLNISIFKHIGLLVLSYIVLAIFRGSQKFPSLIGVRSCTMGYWLLQLAIVGMAIYFYRSNRDKLQFWTAPEITLGEALFQREDLIQENRYWIIEKSFCAGVFSGFGLGGGIFLVPMYRHLKLNPLQATATCTFTIFITATINCLQAIFIGILSVPQFLFYFGISASGSYFLSVVISHALRIANRLSYVELLLVFLLLAANINLPISLWLKYVSSGHNASVVFGFGSPC